jgi:cold shock CspA family protein
MTSTREVRLVTGTVTATVIGALRKSTKDQRGYTFARNKDGVEYFLHQTRVIGDGELADGQRVGFEVPAAAQKGKCPAAFNIRILPAEEEKENSNSEPHKKVDPKAPSASGKTGKTSNKKALTITAERIAVMGHGRYQFLVSCQAGTRLFIKSTLPSHSHSQIIWSSSAKCHSADKGFRLGKAGNRLVRLQIPGGLGAKIHFADAKGVATASLQHYCVNK